MSILLLLTALALPALADEPECTVSTQEAWCTFFGGDDLSYHLLVACPTEHAVRVTWTLSAEGHAIARDEQTLTVSADAPGSVAVQAKLPPVKEGVIASVDLAVSVSGDGGGKPLAALQRTLWVFPQDPFVQRTKWLEGLKITLFDPEKRTAKQFDDAHIPYTLLANVDALPEVNEGMLVIGEGVSFDIYRGLMEMLVRTAAGGRPVLCLAPAGGGFPLPGTESNDWPAPDQLLLKRASVITALDKRLDARSWIGEINPVANSLHLRAVDGVVRGEIRTTSTGWSWLEMQFPPAQSRMVLCGFGIIEHWASGPTPRFLLARLLEYVVGDSPSAEKKP